MSDLLNEEEERLGFDDGGTRGRLGSVVRLVVIRVPSVMGGWLELKEAATTISSSLARDLTR